MTKAVSLLRKFIFNRIKSWQLAVLTGRPVLFIIVLIINVYNRHLYNIDKFIYLIAFTWGAAQVFKTRLSTTNYITHH